MADILYVPTKPRSEEEEQLLDEIAGDMDLANDGLRKKTLDYMGYRYALVFWHHLDANIRLSFEEPNLAKTSRRQNKDTFPRIIGVRTYQDISMEDL